MVEHIKKFDTASAADQYEIKDIPFITSIGATGPQNLVCNEEGKKLAIEDGQVVVENIIYETEDPEEPEELPLFYETMSYELSLSKIDENTPDSIPFLVGCLGFVDGWFGTSYGEDLEKDEVINWYTKNPIDLGQIYEMSKTFGQQHAQEPQFRDPYFAVGYIDGYLDYLGLDNYHHYLANELGIDVLMSSEKPGYEEGAQQGYNTHAMMY